MDAGRGRPRCTTGSRCACADVVTGAACPYPTHPWRCSGVGHHPPAPPGLGLPTPPAVSPPRTSGLGCAGASTAAGVSSGGKPGTRDVRRGSDEVRA